MLVEGCSLLELILSKLGCCFNDPEYKDRKKKLKKDRLCIKCLLPHEEDIPCTSNKKCHWKKTHHSSMCPEDIEIKWEESDGQSNIFSVHQLKLW
ncbi:hypothetical protein CRE_16209 [Caenorhabditis remanei]|uniref:Uncharacterized protein n=1 Tax=Caenorhabditis remanei TaxID=31234 RepID=E3MSL2_CAERE|nr:hypothetical protein CRE_16209 [Caenorhabditis remanei]